MDKAKVIDCIRIEILKADADRWTRGQYVRGLQKALEIIEKEPE